MKKNALSGNGSADDDISLAGCNYDSGASTSTP